LDLQDLKNKKIIFASKEAGAGSLLGALVKTLEPVKGSIAIASPVSFKYFENTDLNVYNTQEVNLSQIKKIILDFDPHYIIVGSSAGSSIEKDLMILAQQIGYKVISVIDHFWNLWQRFANENTAEKWYYKPDYIFVPHDACVNKLIELGWESDKINSFIHPLFNSNKLNQQLIKEDIFVELEIKENYKIITFASEYNFDKSDMWNWEQSSDSDIKDLLSYIIHEIEDLNSKTDNKLFLLVKLHPSQDNIFDNILKNHTFYKVVKDFRKDKIFKISSIVVGLNSMFLLEASSLSVPTYSYTGQLPSSSIRLNMIDQDISTFSKLNDLANIFRSHCLSLIHE
jgi:hypothetical protein